jgi:hypothetical protein
MGVNGSNAVYLATIWAIPAVIAITFHEAAQSSCRASCC